MEEGRWSRIRTDIRRLKGLSSMGFANIIVNVISGLFWLYVAKIIGVANYGEISYFISIAITSSTISFLGADNALMVFSTKNEKILPPIFLVTSLASLVTAIILFAILHDVGTSLYVIGMVVFSLMTFEAVGKKNYKKYSKLTISQRILAVVLALSLYYTIGPHGIILGYALSYFPFTLKMYSSFKGAIENLHVLRKQFSFMTSSYAYSVIMIFTTSVDKLIIFPIFGFAMLGNYQLGAQLLTILNILPYTVFQYILPHDAIGAKTKRIKITTIVVAILLTILVIVLTPIVLPALFPKYIHATQIIQIMSLAVIPYSVIYMYVSKFLGARKGKIITIGAAIYLTSEIISILTLSKAYGITGAPAGVVLGLTCEMAYLIIIDRITNSSQNLAIHQE